MDRIVITVTATGMVSIICDHCGMDELVAPDRAASFVRGRIAAHVGVLTAGVSR